LERNAKRCNKEEAAEKLKLKKAIEQQNFDGAKIHAEAAIRKKNEALNYLRLASRIDGVASQVQTAVSMQTVSKSMGAVVEGLNKALEANQMEKVSLLMDKFETQVENLNVQTSYMESAMSNTSAMTTPDDQVQDLMQQVADQHGLELGSQLGHVPSGAIASPSVKEVESDPLTERLAKLRNS
jgi:charged multivesicular body protein 1